MLVEEHDVRCKTDSPINSKTPPKPNLRLGINARALKQCPLPSKGMLRSHVNQDALLSSSREERGECQRNSHKRTRPAGRRRAFGVDRLRIPAYQPVRAFRMLAPAVPIRS